MLLAAAARPDAAERGDVVAGEEARNDDDGLVDVPRAHDDGRRRLRRHRTRRSAGFGHLQRLLRFALLRVKLIHRGRLARAHERALPATRTASRAADMPGQMTHLRRICLLALHASALREMGASLRVVSLVSSDPLAASRPLLVGESIRFQPTPKQAQAVAATVAQASLDACDVGGDEVLGECARARSSRSCASPGSRGRTRSPRRPRASRRCA